MSVEKIVARASRHIQADAERIFDAWLDPQRIGQWMSRALKDFGLSGEMRRVEVDAREGGRFTFSDMRAAGEAVHWGTYLAIERPHRLVFTWFTSLEEEQENASTVTLSIEPQGDGCMVTITHEMDAKWAEYVEKVSGGWRRMLEQTGALLVSMTSIREIGA